MAILDFSISNSNQWSSVEELFEGIEDRIPEEKIQSLFPVLNTCLRTIAKRLMILHSDLIIGSLSVPVYASQSYTANTIAFISGTPPTITDSASGFVTAGMKAGMYSETDSTNNPGPFRIATVAASTLTLARTNSVISEAAGSNVSITTIADYAPLPDDFWGLATKPWIDTKTWALAPLPSLETRIQYTSAGVPYYYQVKGSDLWVYPGTSSDITIKGDYFMKPPKVSQMQDRIPYDQLLDDVIQEYLVMVLGGGSALTATALKQFLEEQVDLVVGMRGKKAAAEMPDGLNYSDYME